MKRIILLLLCAAAASCSSKTASAPSPAPPSTAPPPAAAELARSGLAVSSETLVTLTDAARRRDVVISVTYPSGAGPFPVIVFSHGSGGSPEGYRPLLRFWATRGYVLLAPTHVDRGAAGPGAAPLDDPKTWESRARDIAFVLDSLSEIGARVAPLSGKLDAGRVGVGGHSFGAFTAGLVAGATVDLSKKEKDRSFADPRPSAFLLLSPPGRGARGWTDRSWTNVTRPLLDVTGSRDGGPNDRKPSWRLDACRLSPPGDRFCLVIRGASHLSFAGRYAEPGASLSGRGKGAPSADEEVAIFKDVKAATVAFWDAYVKGDAAAKAFLESDRLETESGGRASLERR